MSKKDKSNKKNKKNLNHIKYYNCKKKNYYTNKCFKN